MVANVSAGLQRIPGDQICEKIPVNVEQIIDGRTAKSLFIEWRPDGVYTTGNKKIYPAAQHVVVKDNFLIHSDGSILFEGKKVKHSFKMKVNTDLASHVLIEKSYLETVTKRYPLDQLSQINLKISLSFKPESCSSFVRMEEVPMKSKFT
ncbi:hypothetical protein A9Q91_04065 [Candidatus Gracilibacteria bacterium 28_42_T64]|nr:hypothetical protein A9Q91_04065 [Candidatus Gracilibacteria bacterium 28_42_T64]